MEQVLRTSQNNLKSPLHQNEPSAKGQKNSHLPLIRNWVGGVALK